MYKTSPSDTENKFFKFLDNRDSEFSHDDIRECLEILTRGMNPSIKYINSLFSNEKRILDTIRFFEAEGLSSGVSIRFLSEIGFFITLPSKFDSPENFNLIVLLLKKFPIKLIEKLHRGLYYIEIFYILCCSCQRIEFSPENLIPYGDIESLLKLLKKLPREDYLFSLGMILRIDTCTLVKEMKSSLLVKLKRIIHNTEVFSTMKGKIKEIYTHFILKKIIFSSILAK